jgi:hypothetical protein
MFPYPDHHAISEFDFPRPGGDLRFESHPRDRRRQNGARSVAPRIEPFLGPYRIPVPMGRAPAYDPCQGAKTPSLVVSGFVGHSSRDKGEKRCQRSKKQRS